jgi:hypothetical protein
LILAKDEIRTLSKSILIGLADSTELSLAESSLGLLTRVHTRRVGAPEIKHDICERGAGPHIQKLDIKEKRDTLLILTDVMTNDRTVDVCITSQ